MRRSVVVGVVAAVLTLATAGAVTAASAPEHRGAFSSAPATSQATTSSRAESQASTSGRRFGVMTDPWSIDDFARQVGARPSTVMEYEAWSKDRVLDNHFAEARAQGLNTYVLSWEPWRPVPAKLGHAAQYRVQPAYANARIASGALDGYVRRMASSVKRSGLTVYIRYAHEMNGDWYPWSHDPAGYVQAWRHVVTVFRSVGATNARFVWAPNGSLYQNDADWVRGASRYWPGAAWVDAVGITAINFGGGSPCSAVPCSGSQKTYPVRLFAQRMALQHARFGKTSFIEFNTAKAGRTTWLSDLDRFLESSRWVRLAVLSQAHSRASDQFGTGNLAWNVTSDPASKPYVRHLIATMRG